MASASTTAPDGPFGTDTVSETAFDVGSTRTSWFASNNDAQHLMLVHSTAELFWPKVGFTKPAEIITTSEAPKQGSEGAPDAWLEVDPTFARALSATAAGVTITSPSILTVNAPFAQFTGLLQASTIIAGAYTPAPGDTFGL